MRAKTAIRIYPGIVEAVAEERFRTHEREMAWQGWYAAESHWDGTGLRVVYTRRRPDPWGEDMASGSEPLSHRVLVGFTRLRRA
jgi:hypothetical protein